MAGCLKKEDFPDIPHITYEQTVLNQTPLSEADSLGYVRFRFTDGDGDLGFPGNDPQPSIFIQDARDSFPKYSYKIPYVEPQGTGNGISGDISIVLPTTCCIYVNPQGVKLACKNVPAFFTQDEFFYRISIKDRAGHVSNTIETDKIKLLCF